MKLPLSCAPVIYTNYVYYMYIICIIKKMKMFVKRIIYENIASSLEKVLKLRTQLFVAKPDLCTQNQLFRP